MMIYLGRQVRELTSSLPMAASQETGRMTTAQETIARIIEAVQQKIGDTARGSQFWLQTLTNEQLDLILAL